MKINDTRIVASRLIINAVNFRKYHHNKIILIIIIPIKR